MQRREASKVNAALKQTTDLSLAQSSAHMQDQPDTVVAVVADYLLLFGWYWRLSLQEKAHLVNTKWTE
jgi:hypothetical protein